jgi:hypothetical protein
MSGIGSQFGGLPIGGVRRELETGLGHDRFVLGSAPRARSLGKLAGRTRYNRCRWPNCPRLSNRRQSPPPVLCRRGREVACSGRIMANHAALSAQRGGGTGMHRRRDRGTSLIGERASLPHGATTRWPRPMSRLLERHRTMGWVDRRRGSATNGPGAPRLAPRRPSGCAVHTCPAPGTVGQPSPRSKRVRGLVFSAFLSCPRAPVPPSPVPLRLVPRCGRCRDDRAVRVSIRQDFARSRSTGPSKAELVGNKRPRLGLDALELGILECVGSTTVAVSKATVAPHPPSSKARTTVTTSSPTRLKLTPTGRHEAGSGSRC